MDTIEKAYEDIKEISYSLTRGYLMRGPTREGATKLAAKIAGLVDRQLQQLEQNGKKLACQKGCSACCYGVIHASFAEIIAIYEHVMTWSVEDRQALIGRLEIASQKVDEQIPEWQTRYRHPCPFLQNDLCSIYEKRPLFCRGLTSEFQSLCEETKVFPMLLSPFGPNQEQGIAMKSYEGTHLVFLTSLTLNFPHVLLKLFQDPSSVERLMRDPKSFELERRFPWQIEVPDSKSKVRHDPYMEPNYQRFRFERMNAMGPDELGLLGPRSASNTLARIFMTRGYDSVAHKEELWQKCQDAVAEIETLDNWDPELAYRCLHDLYPITAGYQCEPLHPMLERLGTALTQRVARKLAPELLEPLGTRKPGKVRVAVMGDIGTTNGSFWTVPWLRGFDRSQIEVFGLKVDGIDTVETFRLKDAVDHYRVLHGHPLDIVRYIRSLDLDYLLVPDVGDNGFYYQLILYPLARRQGSGWGGPFTTGLPTFHDYLSSEFWEEPAAQADYTEQLIRLPGVGLTLDRPNEVPMNVSRERYGLPSGHLVVFPQYVRKWIPDHDTILKELSDRMENPIYFFEMGSPEEKAIFMNRMDRLGVRTQWLKRLPVFEFRAAIKLFDAVLDSPAWSGGITAMECLTSKTPIVNWPGPALRHRLARGFCYAAGVPELCVENANDFVELALDGKHLASIRERIEPAGIYNAQKPLEALQRHILETAGA